MKPIGTKYNAKTIQAAENVQSHLERGLKVHFDRAYRTQGSVRTNTNIRVHSDFDLLTIIDKYFYPQTSTRNVYTESDPDADIEELRKQATAIMKFQYDTVDDSGDKCISIENKHLNRKVDIVFAYWYNSDKYQELRDEFYRGVYLYSFKKKTKHRDFPFATIHNVNVKGDTTNDGLRKGVRLLKNLRANSDVELKVLKSFQLNSIVYAIDNTPLTYTIGDEIRIARVVSEQMGKLIDNPTYRKSISSPNGVEKPLYDDNTVPELILLKGDLDTLIEDASKDLYKSHTLQRTLLSY
ncbi:nucleotidyltransferase family protein [Mucilaginibacter pallidiroseus]|nr:hypothetical protein [Mucilaginibacter pallidiroseus]